TTTNFDGSYYFETRSKADSIAATFVGYNKQVQRIKLNQYQEINFKLSSANVSLAEVVIVAGENPADIIMRKVIANKAKNSSQVLESIQYEAYNKIQLDANNFDNKLKDRKLMKQFGFVFDYVDTSSVNGKTYLPVFISEVLSNVYVRNNPDGKIEDIVAARGSGIENPSIVQFMGNLYQEVKIYDNYVQLLEKNFISPVADFGFTFYRYYLVDSAYIDQNWCYKLMFKPRRKQELAFTGELWIHDTTFAVKRVEFKVDESANLNFVSDVTIIQDYSFINNQFWYLTSDYLVADFNFSENNKNLPGFFGQRTTTYRNFIVNEPKEAKFYRQPVKVTMEEGSLDKTPE
ncbi:MAG: DUF5686 family protein, partial [Ignavibacteria bacterium]|nr:DUF5686 family protein [Ignavibacteria bacterium]